MKSKLRTCMHACIDLIVRQLLDKKIIVGKPIRPDSTVVKFYVNPNAEELQD